MLAVNSWSHSGFGASAGHAERRGLDARSMAVRLSAGAGGMFIRQLSIFRNSLNGPLRARFMAWNSSPGDNNYTWS